MAKQFKGTGSNPLKMAKFLSEEVNESFEDGSFLSAVSPITQDLLKYWFDDGFCDMRDINFHEGQKQAILNIIYLHEVKKTKSVKDLYLSTDPEILQSMDIEDLSKEKYSHPMYAVKMATGTGKTWVLNAILIWQFLNAHSESYYINNENSEKSNNRQFSKNFLLVAPGLIVYNRLLDAFLGKENQEGNRDFEKSDFFKFKELFIPPNYRDNVLSFIQSSVSKKEEISSKVTGDGLIAITNWHLLAGNEEEIQVEFPLDEPVEVINKVLPIAPGKAGGNALETLDKNYLKGKEIDYLAELNDLVVFNDEAHHIHEIKKNGEIFEVEWQKSLNKIAKSKGNNFIQIDFSATPYNSTGGKEPTKHYFPHIIVDFDLKEAIHKGLVKMIAIDKRKEIASTELDFKAIKDGNKVIGLSDGQKLMLRAGITKLDILDEEFSKIGKNKHPKMLVMCEDTKVAPLVHDFLVKDVGLLEEDVIEIHSNRKGEISEKEWAKIKQKLFDIDSYDKPKVIISVLMLREGFDVNNISVIVPLRSTKAPILLEQTIGRGLRLMWRESEFEDIKREMRKSVLIDKKEPQNHLDLLSIVEHPAFDEFYKEFIDGDKVVEITDEIDRKSVLGDMIAVSLRDDYKDYDFYWPVILREKEEVLSKEELSLDRLEPFKVPFDKLQKIKGEGGETFVGQELTVGTKFGEYPVKYKIDSLFTANSYNDFITKIINTITTMLHPVKRKTKSFPIIQVNTHELVGLIDKYIRNKLFTDKNGNLISFDPFSDENWKILIMSNDSIVKHIIKHISKKIYEMQTNVDVHEAEVKKIFFSQVELLRMRENYSIKVAKSIYERLPYPSTSGGLEKLFIESVDGDGMVDSFLKINEYYHTFATIRYIREDGLIARYFPDFLVKIDDNVYVVETKADKDISSYNVQAKRKSTFKYIEQINDLQPENRMESKWHYVLLKESTLKRMLKNNASIKEILDSYIMTEGKIEGTLDDFLAN